MSFLVGWLCAFLPVRYRRGFYVSPAAALWSGLSEFLPCLVLFIYRYFTFSTHQLAGGTGSAMMGAASKGGDAAVMGSGLFMMVNYIFDPLTLLNLYFLVEGILRTSATIVTGEVVPILPLQLIAWGHGKLEDQYSELAAGPRIADEVERLPLTINAGADAITLRIASCRAKENWTALTTIVYEDQLFELARQEKDGSKPSSSRPFIYFLRKKPEWKIVRGVHNYDPEEVLSKTEE
jgi:hypothetical protein